MSGGREVRRGKGMEWREGCKDGGREGERMTREGWSGGRKGGEGEDRVRDKKCRGERRKSDTTVFISIGREREGKRGNDIKEREGLRPY